MAGTKPPNEMSAAELHSAGATVRHDSPFGHLRVPECALDGPQVPDWAARLFRVGLFEPAELESLIGPHFAEVDEALVLSLLSVFNWRPRTIGAYLAARKDIRSLEETIGNLLLRSDVCYAGTAYCVALARFNSPRAIRYFVEYLHYYLSRDDLWFDPMEVLAALTYLDGTNHTALAATFERQWSRFVRNKPRWQLTDGVCRFSKRMSELLAVASRLGRAT
jgi:hypothetical protein